MIELSTYLSPRGDMQVTSRRMTRMLLGANDTVAAVLELEGTSSAAALAINSDLGNSLVERGPCGNMG